MGLMKILLFIFNFIFVILGIVLIVSGVLIHTSDKDVDILTDTALPFLSVGTLVIVLGVIVFIVAFTGCCGAIKENKCLLTTFIVLLLIILAIELVCVILGYLYQGQVESILTDGIIENMDQYAQNVNGTDNVVKDAWDQIQMEGECCGVLGRSDWWMNGTFAENMVPASCCMDAPKGQYACASADAYMKGCKDRLIMAVKNNLVLSGTLSLVILLAEIFGIIFACCVLKDVRDKGETA